MENMSRRNFVKMSMVGAGALALSSVNASASAVDAKDVKFDEEWDVVIIGSGFSGLAAGLVAAKKGNKVLILEKMGRIGGNSVINGGGMSVPVNPVQAKDGIKDSKELFMADCLKAGLGINHPELLQTLADRGTDAYKFLVDNGVQFKDHCAHFGGHSVPRSMLTTNDSGSGYIQPMLEKFEALKDQGCELRRRAKFDDFVMEGDRVVGVTIREEYKFDANLYSDDLENTSGTKKTIKAKKGVVLASGGFGRDRAFRKLQDPRIPDDVDSTNHAGATAGALLKAFEIGAYPVQIDWIQFGPWASPDEKGFGTAPILTQQGTFKYGIAVDIRNGKRFMNELADRKTRADAEFKILRETPGAYPITFGDDKCFRDLSEEIIQKGMAGGKLVGVCKSLDEIASKYGVPAAALKETVKKYNEGVKAKKDEFGKQENALSEINEAGPFYVVRLSPKPHHTMGGLKINEKAEVISSKTNKPIPGLYAAGEVTGGTHGASRLGTVAITDCIVFGMIAGEAM
ncbi:flavocytochrome c [Campylobacter sp. RM13119]|uniref:flavocytochrome c n=1 Tax=Campylobacter TaxID=194 RepID=UPI00147460DF|nr:MULTISPECIES: flavocytochrome c [unclassified Campylobacter]MBE3021729.1 flavocytochrome c [Campylobacter sp. 7477a]MBE3606543.1 flavocytochrome c [Campylobacter sp. RM13119]MBE3610620.1 flavocytochrome c [Campylobacter sp. RM12916]